MVLLPGFITTAILQEGKKAVLYRAIRVVDDFPVIMGYLKRSCHQMQLDLNQSLKRRKFVNQ
jgi:uncharacterized protein with ACT and thioredoxin-like domain